VDASVIIPTHNQKAALRRCLEAVLAQRFDGSFEVLVCDDGSQDGTSEMLEAWQLTEPRLLYLPQAPKGPAAARNRGLRLARTPLVAMTDDDTIPQPGWLAALCRAAATPGVVAVEGRVTPGRPLGPAETAPLNQSGGVYLTCNALYLREALIRIGGFDERFPYAAFEDCDLAARLKQLGRIAWAPDAVVLHPPRLLNWASVNRRLRHWPWAMVTARRYGYLAWPQYPTRHPRGRVLWNAVVKLPAGRLLAALRAIGSHPGQALRAAAWALAEPLLAVWRVTPEVLRFDLESAAFHLDFLDLDVQRPPVAVVVVSHKENPELLLRCLRSLGGVDYPGLRLIVVASEALEESIEPLRREAPGVEWIVVRQNLGYTEGNNRGILRALACGCEFVLVLNPDTECIAPDFITQLVRFLELNPKVAVVGPRVFLRRPGEVQNTILRYPSPLRSLADWFGFRLFPHRYERSGSRLRNVEMINGVCVMLRGAALRQVGMFDPRFFMYVEDADLGLRLRQAGWQLAYLPIDSILHHQKEQGYDLYGWVSLMLRRNSVYFLRKHRRPAQAFCLAGANLVLALLRACGTTSAAEFRRRFRFWRALWWELRGVLWTGRFDPAGSWRPESKTGQAQ